MRIGILSAELGEEDVHENKRLVREIRLMGHRAQIINYRKSVIVTSKNKQILYHPDKAGNLRHITVNAVIPRINEADENSIALATLALECLISSGVYSTASPAGIRLSKDKIGSLLALNRAGIATPRTAIITSAKSFEIDIDKVLKAVEANTSKRLIIKTNIGTQGKGVMSANSRGEARAIVDGFLANGIPILLQQFVEPTKKDQYVDIRIIVVNGKAVSAMKRVSARKDEIRANLSLGGKGLAYTPSESEIQMAEAAAKAVGLSVGGVDIIPSGSHRLVIEINSSPGFMIEKVDKVNLAKKIVRQAVTNAQRYEKRAMEKLTDKLNQPITVKSLQPLTRNLQPLSLKKLKIKPNPLVRN